MAVLIMFTNVVVPVSVLEERYPGGFAGYRRDCAGDRSYCCDGHLTRVGFMSADDVEDFVCDLERKGLQLQENGTWKDAAVVDVLAKAPTLPCDWVHVDKSPVSSDFGYSVGGQEGDTLSAAFSIFF